MGELSKAMLVVTVAPNVAPALPVVLRGVICILLKSVALMATIFVPV